MISLDESPAMVPSRTTRGFPALRVAYENASTDSEYIAVQSNLVDALAKENFLMRDSMATYEQRNAYLEHQVTYLNENMAHANEQITLLTNQMNAFVTNTTNEFNTVHSNQQYTLYMAEAAIAGTFILLAASGYSLACKAASTAWQAGGAVWRGAGAAGALAGTAVTEMRRRISS